MSHEHHKQRLHDGMTHVGSQPHAIAKKEALFNLVHSDITDTANEQRALGATEEQLAPLLDRQRAWEEIKDHAVSTDLS